MTFEEWKQWKETQTEPTCDYVGCIQPPIWILPQNRVFFCAEHAAGAGGSSGLASMYSEAPVFI